MGRIIGKLKAGAGRVRKALNRKTISLGIIGASALTGAIEGPKWHRLYIEDSLNRANLIIMLERGKEHPSPKQMEIQARISGYLFPRYVGAMEVVKKQTIDFIKNASRSKLEFFIKARSEERQELQKIIEFGNSAEIDGKRRGIKELKNLEKFYDFILNEAKRELKQRPKSNQKQAPVGDNRIVLAKAKRK